MGHFYRLKAIEKVLKIEVFTIDFEILGFLHFNGRAGIDAIRRTVRGSPGAVSYKLRRMLEMGLVIRSSDPEDRRISHYELSAYALEAINSLKYLPESADIDSRAA